MTRLDWDQTAQRFYETGLSHGVLYLPSGGVAWNGLTSVEETDFDDSVPLYYDGVKYNDTLPSEDYTASIKAVTYPDELLLFEGYGQVATGVFADDQPTSSFGLSYRTRVGDPDFGTQKGYKLHVVYNLTAVEDDVENNSNDSNISFIEFGWTVNAVPVSLAGFKPTAHIIFDSTVLPKYMLLAIEDILYGTATAAPRLPTLSDLSTLAINWKTIIVTDNGDGTWTAVGPDEYLVNYPDGSFDIFNINATWLDDDTYRISDT